MLLGRAGLHFANVGIQSGHQKPPGIRGIDHIIHMQVHGGKVRIGELPAVFSDFFLQGGLRIGRRCYPRTIRAAGGLEIP